MLLKSIFLLVVLTSSTYGNSVGSRTPRFRSREQRCPQTMMYVRCGSGCGSSTQTCQQYYSGQNAVGTEKCSKRCIARCECPKGTVKGPGDFCIPPDECPDVPQVIMDIPYFPAAWKMALNSLALPARSKRCPPTKVLEMCASACSTEPSTCEEYRKFNDEEFKKQQSVLNCSGTCGPACVCPKGMVTGPDDLCIPPENCPPEMGTIKDQPAPTETLVTEQPPNCPFNMVWRNCATRCEQTCEAYHEGKTCTLGCSPPRCQCPGGKVQEPDGPCITPDKCPPAKKSTE